MVLMNSCVMYSPEKISIAGTLSPSCPIWHNAACKAARNWHDISQMVEKGEILSC